MPLAPDPMIKFSAITFLTYFFISYIFELGTLELGTWLALYLQFEKHEGLMNHRVHILDFS